MICAFTSSFNRTSMELKRNYETVIKVADQAFNRTSMELKHNLTLAGNAYSITFNRTSMELKPDQSVHIPSGYVLLIEPVWN